MKAKTKKYFDINNKKLYPNYIIKYKDGTYDRIVENEGELFILGKNDLLLELESFCNEISPYKYILKDGIRYKRIVPDD